MEQRNARENEKKKNPASSNNGRQKQRRPSRDGKVARTVALHRLMSSPTSSSSLIVYPNLATQRKSQRTSNLEPLWRFKSWDIPVYEPSLIFHRPMRLYPYGLGVPDLVQTPSAIPRSKSCFALLILVNAEALIHKHMRRVATQKRSEPAS